MRLHNNKARQEQAISATLLEIEEIEKAIEQKELDAITGSKVLTRLHTKLERQRENLDVTNAQIRVQEKNIQQTKLNVPETKPRGLVAATATARAASKVT